MKMQKIMKSMVLLFGVLLVLQGCEKEGNFRSRSHSDVKFKAAAGYPSTRTEYSGSTYTDGGVTYERINWVDGTDIIRVYGTNAVRRTEYEAGAADANLYYWANYKIKDTRADGRYSRAKLENIEENALMWMGEASTFYAFYPASGVIHDDATGPNTHGSEGEFKCEILTEQAFSAKGNMNYAYMAAKAADVAAGSDVTLDFYPAFSAFEFSFSSAEGDLYLKSFTLQSASKPLSGVYSVLPQGTSLNYTHLDDGVRYVTVDLGNKLISPSSTVSFTVFTKPCTVNDLSIKMVMATSSASDAPVITRTLALKKADNTPVEFIGGHKYKITGVKVQGEWTFKTITLNGEVLSWTSAEEIDHSDEIPQASQFIVTGDGVKNVYDLHTGHTDASAAKAYRQHWVLGANTATVTFDIFSPVGGTYEVVPQGATDKFTVTSVTGYPSGTIADPRVPGQSKTKVSFTVKANANATADDLLWFRTYVTSSAGVQYSLDSETQLYDVRGYHYFRTTDPLAH